MELVHDLFDERKSEIEDYLAYLQSVEQDINLRSSDATKPGTSQFRVMKSVVYVQLYNMIEASVTQCIGAIERAIVAAGTVAPPHLSVGLLELWVRDLAKIYEVGMGEDKRLQHTLNLLKIYSDGSALTELTIGRGGGGNWEDVEVKRFCDKLGLKLEIDSSTEVRLKRNYRNDHGPLKWIVKLRNDLAHGNSGFGEVGDQASVSDLRDLADIAIRYLTEVIAAFDSFITDRQYLRALDFLPS